MSIYHFIWDFKRTIEKPASSAIVLLLSGIAFFFYVLIHVLFFSSKIPNKYDSKYEILIAALYFCIFFVGFLLNRNNLNKVFFSKLGLAIFVVLGRTLFLLFSWLLIFFIIKSFYFFVLNLNPAKISIGTYGDLFFYYPFLQFPLFFIQYKKSVKE